MAMLVPYALFGTRVDVLACGAFAVVFSAETMHILAETLVKQDG